MSLGWDIFQQMERLRRDMDSFLGADAWGWRTRPTFRWSFLPGRAARAYPLLNVGEDENNVYIDALAPGLKPDSVNITAVGEQLSIAGEKPVLGEGIQAEAYHRNERAAGRFVRTIALPAPVDQNKAAAEYKNGVLTITVPKAAQAKPRQISITTD
ncbi:Hsp20/alpha crystallin family protein [Candidatus Sumerlaeota bacterium]|nr:Hsp20/alpha crystallin family protein [Candidatus Sumerlaeota bacterium]